MRERDRQRRRDTERETERGRVREREREREIETERERERRGRVRDYEIQSSSVVMSICVVVLRIALRLGTSKECQKDGLVSRLLLVEHSETTTRNGRIRHHRKVRLQNQSTSVRTVEGCNPAAPSL